MTGSSGHLGEALVRVLRSDGHEVVGLDLIESSFTGVVGSICEPTLVATAMEGADAVIHSATLHKPHVGTHSTQDFIDMNTRLRGPGSYWLRRWFSSAGRTRIAVT